VVALNFADTTALDHRLQQFLKANPHYHIVEVVPYGQGPYVIWRYERSTARQGYRPDIGSQQANRHAKAKARHHRAGRRGHGSG
jgi:hypothetical protein